MATQKTIDVKGCLSRREGTVASGNTPTPGAPMQEVPGTPGEYRVYTQVVAGRREAPLLALEDNLLGKTITDAYAAGGRVHMGIPKTGDEVLVFVKSAEDITSGDQLEPESGTGLFVEVSGAADQNAMFEALESPGALAANTHVLCRFIG